MLLHRLLQHAPGHGVVLAPEALAHDVGALQVYDTGAGPQELIYASVFASAGVVQLQPRLKVDAQKAPDHVHAARQALHDGPAVV